jgi:hypothetical protein
MEYVREKRRCCLMHRIGLRYIVSNRRTIAGRAKSDHGPKAQHKPAQGKRGTSATLDCLRQETASPDGAVQFLVPHLATIVSPHSGPSMVSVTVNQALPWAGLFSGCWPSIPARIHPSFASAAGHSRPQ